jgi:peroxiredoxin Q/BCP
MHLPLLAVLLGAAPIKAGERAPDFTLPDTEGRQVTLSKLLEAGPVILFFFPKAFTPGCTKQTRAYRVRYADVLQKGAQVVGISVDTIETLRRFRSELGAPFPILADADGAVASRYAGLMPVVKLAKRANVVIGQDGLVKEVVTGGDAVDPSSAIAACPSRRGGT